MNNPWIYSIAVALGVIFFLLRIGLERPRVWIGREKIQQKPEQIRIQRYNDLLQAISVIFLTIVIFQLISLVSRGWIRAIEAIFLGGVYVFASRYVYRRFIRWLDPQDSEQNRQHRNKDLQDISIIFLLLLMILLIKIGSYGWGELQASIDFVTPTAMPTATPPSAGTVTPMLTTTPVVTSTPSTVTEAATTAEGAALFQDKERGGGVIRQHYISLVSVAGILVLLPACLLVAFAFQRVPRLTKDLQNDLRRLGILEEEKQQQQELSAQTAVNNQLNEVMPNLSVKKRMQVVKVLMSGNPSQQIKADVQRIEPSLEKHTDELMQVSQNPPASSSSESQGFDELLAARFGPWEYILPLLPLSLLILACYIWMFFPIGIPSLVLERDFNSYMSARMQAIMPALAGVVSAYVFLIYTLVRRNNGSDLTPGAFWEAVRRLITVLGLGLLLTAFRPTPGTSTAGLIFVAFFIGILPIEALKSFARNGQIVLDSFLQQIIHDVAPDTNRSESPDLSNRLSPRHELYVLDDLDEWDALRLEEANIIGLQGMATADLGHLITWTPFPTSQVLDWVDQAILFLVSGAEPTTSLAPMFRTIGLRRASTLVEMCERETGKQTVVLAAKAVQSKGVFDHLPMAQLAAMRAQSLIHEMQDQVVKMKDKKADDNLDDNLRSEIESTISFVRNSKVLVDQAYEQVKVGGVTLKNVYSNEADKLHTRLESAAADADDVETALKNITGSDPKVSEKLANALKALADQLTADPDCKKLAANLVNELNKIANPLEGALEKAQALLKAAQAIQEQANAKKTEVPPEVQEAANLFASLADLAEKGQEIIQSDAGLEAARPSAGELVDELKADGADKAAQLFGDGKLKAPAQWAEEGADQKAKCYPDAEKLVKHAQVIVKKAEAAEERARNARAEVTINGAPLPLTIEVLDTILAGLKSNANLNRIQHYLIKEKTSISDSDVSETRSNQMRFPYPYSPRRS